MKQIPLLRKNTFRAMRLQFMGLADPKIDIDPAYQQANEYLTNLGPHYSRVTNLKFGISIFY